VTLTTDIDGAYFGATFPHLFIMTYPAVVPSPPTMVYVPRVFGFRIHKETKRDQVSTARQEAAEKMEQLSLRNRKGSPAPGAGVAATGGATAGASSAGVSAGALAASGPGDVGPGAGSRADRGPKL
jgi:hypothetical protein